MNMATGRPALNLVTMEEYPRSKDCITVRQEEDMKNRFRDRWRTPEVVADLPK